MTSFTTLESSFNEYFIEVYYSTNRKERWGMLLSLLVTIQSKATEYSFLTFKTSDKYFYKHL